MNLKLFVLFIMAFGSKHNEDFEEINVEKPILVKIEESECVKKRPSSQYIGVAYHKKSSKWRAQRWSKNEREIVYNGYYGDEETSAHASDTLARKLIANGEQGHKLNFPDDETEVHKRTPSSQYIGVAYNKHISKWFAERRSKNERKMIYNGCHDDEEAAVHASDTLARKLIANGEQGHKLNFPDDKTEVHNVKKRASSQYVGVTYDKIHSKWRAQRHSKNESKSVHYGYYDTEELAAHASDTLARNLMENGEQLHKLNFPDDETEVPQEEHKKKRKRSEDLGNLQDN